MRATQLGITVCLFMSTKQPTPTFRGHRRCVDSHARRRRVLVGCGRLGVQQARAAQAVKIRQGHRHLQSARFAAAPARA